MRVDGFEEIDSETWEQTKETSRQIIQDELKLQGINIERTHVKEIH